MNKTRQEEAYEYVSRTFIKLLKSDDRIPYEHKRSVLAFWEDLFAHEGVRNNMLLAFSNFLDEIDKRVDASRKAGIASVRTALIEQVRANGSGVNEYGSVVGELNIDLSDTILLINSLLEAEDTEEEILTDIENIDLTEIGGEDEDNTPLI